MRKNESLHEPLMGTVLTIEEENKDEEQDIAVLGSRFHVNEFMLGFLWAVAFWCFYEYMNIRYSPIVIREEIYCSSESLRGFRKELMEELVDFYGY